MKGLMWIFISWTILCLSACKTFDAETFFDAQDRPDMIWSPATFATQMKRFHQKPLSKYEIEAGEGVYRMIIRAPSVPVFMIRVQVSSDNKHVVHIWRTKGGYCTDEGKILDRRITVRPSDAEVEQFLQILNKNEFWNQSEVSIFEDDYLYVGDYMHHLIEGRTTTESVAYGASLGYIRKNTGHIALAFYDIANLDPENDENFYDYFEGLAEYFDEHAEK